MGFKVILIFFPGSETRVDLALFTDAGFASCHATRRLCTGIWIDFNGSPIYWASRRQTVVSDSTTASELIAAHHGVRYLRDALGNFRAAGFPLKYTPHFIDNDAALRRIPNNRSHDGHGAKNVSVGTKMLQEAVSPDHADIWPMWVNILSNAADMFTKSCLAKDSGGSRWKVLEARIRGEADLKWVEELVHEDVPTPVSASSKSKRNIKVMQISHLMDSVPKILDVSGRGKPYPDAFEGTVPATNRPPSALALVATEETSLEVRPHASAEAFRAAIKSRKLTKFKVPELFSGPNKSASMAIHT